MKVLFEAEVQAAAALMYVLDEAMTGRLTPETLDESGEVLSSYSEANSTFSRVVWYGLNAENVKLNAFELDENLEKVKHIGVATISVCEDLDEVEGLAGTEENIVIPAVFENFAFISDFFTMPEEPVIVLEQNLSSSVLCRCVVELQDGESLTDIRGLAINYDGPAEIDQLLYGTLRDQPEYELRSLVVGARKFDFQFECDFAGRMETWECLKLCVSDLTHAVFRYVQASKRPANIMAS